MIKAVIFDLGGVLLRTMDPQPRQQLASQLGLSAHDLERVVYGSPTAALAMVGKITAEQHKQEVLRTLRLSPELVEEFSDRFWGGDHLDWELVHFIRELKGEYTTALLSNAWDDLRALITNTWKIADIFDQIFISAEMGLAKPDPVIYQKVIAALGQEPSQMVFVDDFIENIEAARTAGLQAVHFRDQEGALLELAEYLDQDL
jgi:epoxide hydrolase-like predicted phosphatase